MVSVIVPVYNTESYLKKCLDSLVNQTLKKIEIIIVNDGSTDNSQKIIDEYVKKYPQIIKAFLKKNGGLSDARNYGLKFVTGDYIGFVDSDDFVDLDMFKKLYNKAKKESLDIVVCDSIELYEDNGNKIYKKSNFNYSDNLVKNYIISPPMACTRIYKRNIFDSVEFKKDIFYEDLNLTPSLVLKTKKIGFVEEGLYYYLQRAGSIMKQKDFNIKLLDIFKVLQNNYDLLYKYYPLEIEYLYITHLLRTASLRFLNYNNSKKYLIKICNELKTKFPDWKQNNYYRKSSIKLKFICNLAIHKQSFLLKILMKMK